MLVSHNTIIVSATTDGRRLVLLHSRHGSRTKVHILIATLLFMVNARLRIGDAQKLPSRQLFILLKPTIRSSISATLFQVDTTIADILVSNC